MSQTSQETVWQSLSMSVFHFVNVAYPTFLFLASGADASPELDALFIFVFENLTPNAEVCTLGHNELAHRLPVLWLL